MGNSGTERGISKSKNVRGKRPKKAEVKFPAINNLPLNFLGQHLHFPKPHLNQCNERRDDHGDAFGQQSRELIAEGFSCPCGHAHKNILVTWKKYKKTASQCFLPFIFPSSRLLGIKWECRKSPCSVWYNGGGRGVSIYSQFPSHPFYEKGYRDIWKSTQTISDHGNNNYNVSSSHESWRFYMSARICVDMEATSLRCLVYKHHSVVNCTQLLPSWQPPCVNKSQVDNITNPSFPSWDPGRSIFNKGIT